MRVGYISDLIYPHLNMEFLKQLTRLSIVMRKYRITCLHLFKLLKAYSCYNKLITCKHTVVDLLLLIIIIM